MRKSEKIIFIATPLAETGLICIGFASWNLGTNNGAEANITIESGSLKDTSLKFDSTEMISGALNFDAYSLDSYGKVYASTDADENLELIIDGKVNGYSKTRDLIRVNFRIEPKYLIKYNELIALGYIEEPTFNDLRKDDSSIVTNLTTTGSYWRNFVNNEENNRSFRFRYSFCYGKFFNYENPSLFFDSKNFNGEKTGDSYTFEEKKKILKNLQEINSAKFSVYLDIVDSSKTKTIKFNSNGGSFSSLDTSTTITKSDLILHDKIKFPICYKTNCNFLGWNVNGTLYEGNKYYYVDEIFLDDSLSEISFTAEYEDLTTSGTLNFITGELYANASVKVLIYSNINGLSESSFTNSTGGTITNVLKGDRIKIVPVSNVSNISYTGLSNKLLDGWQNVINNTFSITVTPDELCSAIINYTCSGTKLAETYFEYNFEVKNSSTEKISTYVTSKVIGKGKYIRISDVHGVKSFFINGLTPDSEGYYYIDQSSVTINVECWPSYNLTFKHTSGDNTPTVNFEITNSKTGYSYNYNNQKMGTINNCVIKGDKVNVTGGNNYSSSDAPKDIGNSDATISVVSTNKACLSKGTYILVDYGKYKKIEEIEVGERILVYNSITGKLDYTIAAYIFKSEEESLPILRLKFSNNSYLDIVAGHCLYSKKTLKYEEITLKNVNDYINEEFLAITENDESTSYVTLVSYEIFKTKTIGFGLVSAKHMSCIANGFINITDDIAGLYNYFETDRNLIINYSLMEEDIKKYGLYSYDEWKDWFTELEFELFNIKYLKVSVGKGLLTEDKIKEYVNEYFR